MLLNVLVEFLEEPFWRIRNDQMARIKQKYLVGGSMFVRDN